MLMYPYPYKWRFSSHSMREKSDAFFTIPISSPQLLRSCHIFSPLLSCFSLQCSPLLFVSQLIFLSSLSQSLLLPVATIVSPSLLFSSLLYSTLLNPCFPFLFSSLLFSSLLFSSLLFSSLLNPCFPFLLSSLVFSSLLFSSQPLFPFLLSLTLSPFLFSTPLSLSLSFFPLSSVTHFLFVHLSIPRCSLFYHSTERL